MVGNSCDIKFDIQRKFMVKRVDDDGILNKEIIMSGRSFLSSGNSPFSEASQKVLKSTCRRNV